MRNKLVGWDDGKIYFYNEKSKEYCVNDYKDLFVRLISMCKEYFEKLEKEYSKSPPRTSLGGGS